VTRALGNFSALELRAGYGFTLVRVNRLSCTSTIAEDPRIFFIIPLSITPRVAHLISEWSVLTRHFLCVIVHKSAQNSGGPSQASIWSTLTTHGVRTDQHPTAATTVNLHTAFSTNLPKRSSVSWFIDIFAFLLNDVVYNRNNALCMCVLFMNSNNNKTYGFVLVEAKVDTSLNRTLHGQT